MDNNDSIYNTPTSNLIIKEDLPQAFIDGELTHGKLKFTGWLAIFYMLFQIPTFVISYASGMEPENSLYDTLFNTLTVLDLAIWLYLIVIFKSFINNRFGYTGVNNVINILIILSVLMYGLALFMGEGDEVFDPATIAYFALLIPMGITSVFFGKRLLSIAGEFKYLKSYSWINIISGVCLASVVLFLIAVPLGIVSSLLMALVFFTAAGELNMVNKS